ncbi:MAG: metallophosphoesterase [Actinomycetota bacterium]|nr:metallophosphoesterase [Actinomycetota bacterium]
MPTVRIAAAGDIHCAAPVRDEITASFAAVEGNADVVLLAGDLTRHGEPDEAAVLAEACSGLSIPVVAVLGNHDWHAARRDDVAAVVSAAGIRLLDPGHIVLDVDGTSVGIAGVKGFVGGFPGSNIPDFGEPLLRRVYRETTEEVAALDRALDAIGSCDVRVALLHYAPTMATLEGEPEGIWAMLGSSRLAAPISRDRVDLVLHGHAHEGTFEGRIGNVPVYNVAVQVIRRDFWFFDLDGRPKSPEPPDVHVETPAGNRTGGAGSPR